MWVKEINLRVVSKEAVYLSIVMKVMLEKIIKAIDVIYHKFTKLSGTILRPMD